MPGWKVWPPNRAESTPATAAFSYTQRWENSRQPGVWNAGCRPPNFWALSILVLLTGFSAIVPSAGAQGFGALTKKTIKLKRKMPAIVHLPGPGFDIQVTARDTRNVDAAQMLTDLLTTELQKYDKNLQAKKTAADEVIRCTIMELQIPPPTPYIRNEVVLQKGHSLEEPRQYYKVTGSLSLTYQAKDGQMRILDSDSITARYSQEFEGGTNQATGESIQSKITNPFKRLAGKKTEETFGPPNPIELRQILMRRAVSQLVSRLVNTDETLEIPLARGKLDEANNLAEKGLWSRYLESLETMTPLSSATDDSYRLYNIGVAYEALGYQSEDKTATEKFLEKAAINYGKAIDANPSEKQFAEPQNRIETAVAHYKKIQAGATLTAKSEAAPTPAPASAGDSTPAAVSAPAAKGPAKSATAASGTRSAAAATGKPPGSAAGVSSAGAANQSSSNSKAQASNAPPLTNAQIIKMAKAGVAEDNIIAAIHDATSVQFDLSPDGLVDLASNGVKGKIVSAMQERAKRSSARPIAR